MRSSTLLLTSLISFMLVQSHAATLLVGTGYPYETLPDAAAIALPGDTILVHEGIYPGGVYIEDLQGLPNAWIYLLAATGNEVIFEGGTNAWQFSDAAFLYISGFTFRNQTGNGLNFDDGGSYDSPAHHVIFDNCTFRDINASGNNDLLKLSGLDSFEIRQCRFINGSPGGSGIDMVGCHQGAITNCVFENLGSNAIQAKGGTSHITIEGNHFNNAGARALNLGGSTGLPFFRPIDAPYEAAYLKVYSNIFIGSEAPVAFVGSVYCEVINNTFYLPGKWAMRILQETVDESRFPPCGYNTFRNNIIYLDDRVNVEVNIGPNTAPETFTFSNNLWFHADDSNWTGPELPVTDMNNIIQEDPAFTDAPGGDFTILSHSAAIQNGYIVPAPLYDYDGDLFLSPPSIGAQEANFPTNVKQPLNFLLTMEVAPNPASGHCLIFLNELAGTSCHISIHSIDGSRIRSYSHQVDDSHELRIPLDGIMSGIYIVEVQAGEKLGQRKLIIVQ